ncbi:INO80 complex subunit-like protein [Emericellopsis cladophorae]|uniref:INO80 complex subunit-like protein n=1 Tax=Emericellopsis cladophorae TaxID=2686198 RepID=A0A9Q0BEU1_9HYPO|nr:INO80 complex subunit-like protein [Emericellopsis cladophorae]KAI6782226.1 INO80 complex subunit-like protein [Emericellopsis cladophorae]
MTRESSPLDSPLSSEQWSDHEDESVQDVHEEYETPARPSKRQKTEVASTTSSAAPIAHEAEPEADHIQAPPDVALGDVSDISSDTSADIPSSPPYARPDDEDMQEQVTVCDWDGCVAGDMGDMDRLVDHIHNSHIESRQKKYTCEWNTCSRKGLPHASGYALKAHMRSHTREKPFYCYLPECDRSFTRSDALAKHMRTVHETETLRPSDPVPKSQGHGSKANKLKIIIKTPQSHGNNGDDVSDEPLADGKEDPHEGCWTIMSSDLFSEEELKADREALYKKLYFEDKWAKEENDTLMKECKALEEQYYKEWQEKEVLLSQVIQSEVAWHERRNAILSGAADVHISGPMDSQETEPANGLPDPEPVNTIENGLRPRPVSPP